MKAVNTNMTYVTITPKPTATAATKNMIDAHGPQFQVRSPSFMPAAGDVIVRSVSNSWMGSFPAAEVTVTVRPGQPPLS